MTLNEIKTALANGKTVLWGNEGYKVLECEGSYYIFFARTKDMIGLTQFDGITLNGKEEDFFIVE